MNLDDAPKFLSHLQLAAELAHFQYRPGWNMSVFLHPWEGTFFRVVADVPDAYHPEKTVQLRINSLIPPMQTIEQFDHWLLWRLISIERHEAMEHLCREGRPLVDPHVMIEPMEGDSGGSQRGGPSEAAEAGQGDAEPDWWPTQISDHRQVGSAISYSVTRAGTEAATARR